MQAVASHKSENRMSLSAVAACMAPLILRPLVAGNCEIENGFDLSGNGSLQLLNFDPIYITHDLLPTCKDCVEAITSTRVVFPIDTTK